MKETNDALLSAIDQARIHNTMMRRWWSLSGIAFSVFIFIMLGAVSALIGYVTNIFVVMPITLLEIIFLAKIKSYVGVMHDWEIIYAIFALGAIVSLVPMWVVLIIYSNIPK